MCSKSRTGVFCFLLLLLEWSNGQTFECVDDSAEFSDHSWTTPPGAFYAPTSDDLPGELQGKLGLEVGIFVIEGIGSSQEFTQVPLTITEPIYLYIKYYVHLLVDDGTKFVYILPGLTSDTMVKLPITSDFQWQEQYYEIDATVLPGTGFYVSEINLREGDYFLVEKLIVSQGNVINSIDDLKIECPAKEIPTTTDSSSDSTSTMTSDQTTSSFTTNNPPFTDRPTSTSTTTRKNSSGGLETYELVLAILLPALFLLALFLTLYCTLCRRRSRHPSQQQLEQLERDSWQQSSYPQVQNVQSPSPPYDPNWANYYRPSEKINGHLSPDLYPDTFQDSTDVIKREASPTPNNNFGPFDIHTDFQTPGSRIGSKKVEHSWYYGIPSYDGVLPRLLKNE